MSVRLSKEQAIVLLEKRTEMVNKVCLKKSQLSINFNNLVSRVAVVLDVSGSMQEAFETGMVQATLERLLPLALRFDYNGIMEFWTFNHEFQRHPPLTRANFYDYIQEYNVGYGGGTRYFSVLKDVALYFAEENPANLPAYVIFITDGDSLDTDLSDQVITYASYLPIFFQFIGIGKNTGPKDFRYLRKLDEMDGRCVDNANFFAIPTLSDINLISDEALYMKLLDEYPRWLNYPDVYQMITDGMRMPPYKKKALKKLHKIRGLEERFGGTGGRQAFGFIKDVGAVLGEGIDTLVDSLSGDNDNFGGMGGGFGRRNRWK